MRQLIIARKDLGMLPGKLAAQVAHASMAFLANMIRENCAIVPLCDVLPTRYDDGERIIYKEPTINRMVKEAYERGERSVCCRRAGEPCKFDCEYAAHLRFDKETMEEWFDGLSIKTVCEAKNRNHLLKAATMAEELGLREGKDYFIVRDVCLTELTPEEVDEYGIGITLTCIGFRPLPDDLAHRISRKYQLYK